LHERGCWFSSKEHVAKIPITTWLSNCLDRRTFLLGVVEAAGNYSRRKWTVSSSSKSRMRGLHQLAKSSGVACRTSLPGVKRPLYSVTFEAWKASLDIGTRTAYPSKHELIAKPVVPDEVVRALGPVVQKKLSWLAGSPLGWINRLIKEHKSVSPYAVRACWSVLNYRAPIPAYELVPVVSSVTIPDAIFRQTQTDDTRHLLDLNGFVVEDGFVVSY
jgi:hypothetical protein